MPHELTFPKAKEDRLALLRATRTNTSAIFGVFEDSLGVIAGGISRHIEGTKPTAEATVGDEQHRVWAIGDRMGIGEFRDALAQRRVYIADGHHRYETALAYLAERGAGAADAPVGYVLAYLCAADDPGLRIFATHRIVRGDGALDRAVDYLDGVLAELADDAFLPLDWEGRTYDDGHVFVRGEVRDYVAEEAAAKLLGEAPPPRGLG